MLLDIPIGDVYALTNGVETDNPRAPTFTGRRPLVDNHDSLFDRVGNEASLCLQRSRIDG